MVNSPWLRGMKGYSKVLEPEVPLLSVFTLVFTSYTSKSGGKLILGASSRAILPFPDTVTSSEAASCVFRESLLRRACTLNSPTPPPKLSGAPAGRADTCSVEAFVDTRCRVVT